jgi:thiol-disulfide isomerase/thioredoxin
MKYTISIICLILIISCNSGVNDRLSSGEYVGKLEVEKGKYLPFNFSVIDDSTLVVHNSSEHVEFSVKYLRDSIFINSKTFEGYIKGILKDGLINGEFIIESLSREVPFQSFKSEKRFDMDFEENKKLTSNSWKFIFNPNKTSKSYSIGLFNSIGSNQISATFRTTTGDYGFMQGGYTNNKLLLSTFNGARAYLLEADINGDSIKGVMYAGNHSKTIIEGVLDNTFKLANEYSLTYLKDNSKKFDFSFENMKGELISINDDRYIDKPMVIQMMGSWCPNCLDESRFYVDYLKDNNLKDIEFVGLAFEYAKTKQGALNNILKLKKELGINYPILLAQYGGTDKRKALSKFPMLNNLISYPTTVFLNKNKEVVKIHTGFNGPATGKKYLDFIEEFDRTIKSMVVN